MKHALRLAVESNESVEGLVRIIQVLTTKEIRRLILTTNQIHHKDAIINQLVMFKNDIRIFGDKYARIV